MALRYALIGLLLDRPGSGYDLARRFEEVVGAYAWDARHSQIYPELRQLEGEGLIEVAERGARGRTTYRCTSEGLAALRAWLMAPPARPGGVRNEHVLRLFLLGALGREEALVVLRRTEEGATTQLEHLTEQFARLQEGTGSDSGGPLGLTAQYGIHSYRATAEWARWAIAQVEADPDFGLRDVEVRSGH
ncbi:PadR family transcriptional regulator [Ornithinimicrobium sp. F0845]|uniref:PadR family transcriptional regulator n=1 Tax=Ornithinimicrobium sp. F0845 TaxID=2926412 RepID=UPI001FF5F749|nr:PadR family transcriptional regulator [Ornithinimicrobium sp. F0845]MCK0113890.1 PadR family transcriptional regulator [Ornithinimicrobium sp. F0845]